MILLEAGSAKMAFALIKCAIAQAVKPYGFEFALAIANKVGHPNGMILLEAGSAKMAFALIKCAIAQAVKPYGFELALGDCQQSWPP